MTELSLKNIETIKYAAKLLTSYRRRCFEAQVSLDYCSGNSREAEEDFGWSRHTVELGLNELRSGMICYSQFSERGNQRSEEKEEKLEQDIRNLAEPVSQVDPKFQSSFVYTRITAKAMHKSLIEQGWDKEDLPCEKTIGNILNRLGYRLRRVQKAKPLKKIKETDAIFAKVIEENEASDAREDSLRISIDSKAKLAVGDYSRGGKSRGRDTTKALDHDLDIKKN